MVDRLILFDIDGTLVDMAGAGRRAMEHAFGEVFGIDGFERVNAVPYAGRTDPVILEAVATAVGVEPSRFGDERERLVATFVRSLRKELARADPRRRVLPGVQPLLEHLATLDGVHLGLLTGNLEAGARAKLELFDLNRFFPGGGFASDDPDRREIARIARRKLSRLAGVEFAPDHVAVLGDTELDVDCARANGFRAIAVDSGWASRSSLEQAGPDALLDDLSDRNQVLAALGLDPDR